MSNDHVTGDNTLVSSLTPVVAPVSEFKCPVSMFRTSLSLSNRRRSAVRCPVRPFKPSPLHLPTVTPQRSPFLAGTLATLLLTRAGDEGPQECSLSLLGPSPG